MGGGGAGASRKCGGITILELLRLENAKTVIPPHPWWGGGGAGASRTCGGITVLELLRLENAKTVIPPHPLWGLGLGQAENAGESPFWSF